MIAKPLHILFIKMYLKRLIVGLCPRHPLGAINPSKRGNEVKNIYEAHSIYVAVISATLEGPSDASRMLGHFAEEKLSFFKKGTVLRFASQK